MRSALPYVPYVLATVTALFGVWVLLDYPKWTGRHFIGGLLLTIGIRWMIETTVAYILSK